MQRRSLFGSPKFHQTLQISTSDLGEFHRRMLSSTHPRFSKDLRPAMVSYRRVFAYLYYAVLIFQYPRCFAVGLDSKRGTYMPSHSEVSPPHNFLANVTFDVAWCHDEILILYCCGAREQALDYVFRWTIKWWSVPSSKLLLSSSSYLARRCRAAVSRSSSLVRSR